MRRGIRGIVALKYLTQITNAKGKTYTYYRRKGHPMVRLPDLPHDDPAFLRAYAAACEHDLSAPAGSVVAMCDAAMSSKRLKSRSAAYQRTMRRHLIEIQKKAGDAEARHLKAKHVRINVHGCDNPVDRLKAWRFLCSFALDRGLIEDDPAASVKAPKREKVIGHPTWTDDEVDMFRGRWLIGSAPRAVFELLHWTGARISDAVTLGRQHVDKEGLLTYRQRKTGDLAHVPWTSPLPLYAASGAADRQLMHDAIAALDRRQMTFLATEKGTARSDKSLGNMIRESARDAEVEKSAHGLRKRRAVWLAERGATTHQIAAWTGHQSLKEVEHYTRAAERRRAVMGD